MDEITNHALVGFLSISRVPAACSPLRDGWAFPAERAVVTVPGVEPRVVRQAVEELVLDVVDQRCEVGLAAERVADAARERAVIW
jgi:hypothetical protein